MFSKGDEQELADIKTMIQRLDERLGIVMDRLDGLAEASTTRATETEAQPQDATAPVVAAAEPSAGGRPRKGRRARAAAGEARPAERRGKKAEKRARAAERTTATTEAPGQAEEGGEQPQDGRTKKQRRAARREDPDTTGEDSAGLGVAEEEPPR